MAQIVLSYLKRAASLMGLDVRKAAKRLGLWSLQQAFREQSLYKIIPDLEKVVPDLSGQYSRPIDDYDSFWELKIRSQHAFQVKMMLDAVDWVVSKDSQDAIHVVDIGDSSGTHLQYLAELCPPDTEILGTSVNLDARAVEKIRAKGMRAILCRAEDIENVDSKADLYMSFEMLEHLHNPALFLKRLAVKANCDRMLVTVPMLPYSRVGLSFVRKGLRIRSYAEEEHIFELCPDDWKVLFLHSGWRTVREERYYQYPRSWPVLNKILQKFWQRYDYEGFWGALLEKDLEFCNLYQDWED